ncbi:MAG TPA: terminase TerL endonuclease subunit, partial [Pseudomonadales bacterium]|nr:terminase TerL endonuclease subunit [Pseudomonadales bacterium]
CAEHGVNFPLVEFGQGFKDMGPALDKIEEYILNGNLRHGDNPLLNMCAINSVAVKDPAENRKLEKRKSTGRIDGMVSLAMAVGISCKDDISKAPTSEEIDSFLDSMEFI